MEVVARFSNLLGEAGRQIQSSRKAWTEHLQAVENQQATLKEQYPTPITPNVWASQNTVLAALSRLSAYDELLKKRMQALSPVFHGLPGFDMIHMIGSALQERPISSETRSWQLITAIPGVEKLITESLLLADGLEKVMTYRLEKVTERHEYINSTVESLEFTIICAGVKVIDALKGEMDSRVEVDEARDLREQFEEAYDQGMTAARHTMPKVEWSINIMHAQMVKLGSRVARQTLIWEHFPLLDH
jgi:hypothetical protein